MRRFFALLFSTVILSACASALGDAQQRVAVETPGAHDAVCILNNGDTKYRVWTPGSVMMSKRAADLVVSCVADGNRKKTITIDPDHSPVTLANAFNGFIPGIFIDSRTGALFEYPNIISVDFTDIPATPMPLPHYHKHLAENPDLFGMEEFRAGRAALIRDQYYTDYELQKRTIPGSGVAVPSTSGTADGNGGENNGSAAAGGDVSSSDSAGTGAPSSDMVSDLTKRMNPQVFGPSGSDAGDFVGGTAPVNGGGTDYPPVMDTGPVQIYPMGPQSQ